MNDLPLIFAATCTNMFSQKILCHAHARKAPACLPHGRSNAGTFHVNSPRLTPCLMFPISVTQCKHPIPLGARYNPQNAPILIFFEKIVKVSQPARHVPNPHPHLPSWPPPHPNLPTPDCQLERQNSPRSPRTQYRQRRPTPTPRLWAE